MGETLPIFASTAANHYKSPAETLINSSVVSLNANAIEILIKLKPQMFVYCVRSLIDVFCEDHMTWDVDDYEVGSEIMEFVVVEVISCEIGATIVAINQKLLGIIVTTTKQHIT